MCLKDRGHDLKTIGKIKPSSTENKAYSINIQLWLRNSQNIETDNWFFLVYSKYKRDELRQKDSAGRQTLGIKRADLGNKTTSHF